MPVNARGSRSFPTSLRGEDIKPADIVPDEQGVRSPSTCVCPFQSVPAGISVPSLGVIVRAGDR